MAAALSPMTEPTTMEFVFSLVVSALVTLFILIDAPRVGRSRWWALLGLMNGIGLLAWWIIRTFMTKPTARAGAPGATTAAGTAGAAAGAEATVKCTECGAVATGEYGFCARCGADLPKADAEAGRASE